MLIPGLLTTLVAIILSIKIYNENPKHVENRIFVLLMISFAVIGISNFLVNFTQEAYFILLFARIYYLAAIIAPVIFLHFCYIFPKRTEISFIEKSFLYLQYIFSIIFYFLFLIYTTTNDVRKTAMGNYVTFNEHTEFIGLYLSVILMLSAIYLFKKYRNISSSIERQQLRNVFYGGLIAVSLVVIHITLLSFNILTYFMVPLGIIIFSAFIAAAILRFNLLIYRPMVNIILGEDQISLLNRNQLEKEVEARTAALQETNVKLVKEIEQRKKIESEIKESLKEKEILLKEIHHRVKNNLQIVSSLIYLQSRKMHQKDIIDMLNELNNRIRSMALIHENIYNNNNLDDIDFERYISTLVNELLTVYNIKREKITVHINIEKINIDIDISILLGLIINELVVNVLKHAFPDKKTGEILINAERTDTSIHVRIHDNGIGLPDDFNLEKIESLGLQLVKNLVKQLNGIISIHTNNKTEFHITIPLSKES